MIEELVRELVRDEMAKMTAQREHIMLTTTDVMNRYQIRSKTTLHNYHKMGLRYFKGNPNLYNQEDIVEFFKTNSINK